MGVLVDVFSFDASLDMVQDISVDLVFWDVSEA